MKTYLHYKEYGGSVEFSEEDAVFFGKVVGIKDLISFEGDSVDAITTDFHHAVDEYLAFCIEKGKKPEKPFKGSFNVRISTDLHRSVTAKKRSGCGWRTGSIATAGLLSFIFVKKYADHVPYYRQEAGFERIGVNISRQDMSNWQMKTGKRLEPLIEKLKTHVKSGSVMQMDETPMMRTFGSSDA
ncbi:hypothetical protein AGMMS49944_29940 [Spirochaetia bacterium]|nr:hypothetical protein AGMMS49944_29940 [Spirochaetia bacterium]